MALNCANARAGRTLGGMVGARAWQAASELFAGRHHPGGTAA
jgi:hypothetical protein